MSAEVVAAPDATLAGQSMLDPQGPGAEQLFELGTILTLGTLIPAVLTIVILLVAVFRRRTGGVELSLPTAAQARNDRRVVLLAGALVPLLILLVLFLSNVRIGAQAAAPPADPVLTVDLIGHQFWWEIHYPDHDVVTANELHIPAGRPVRIRTTSADVIHSFWVPQLHGKIDMTPGKTAVFWLQADRPGHYRGQCTEFCGVQHALMAMLVVADAPEAFDAWLAHHQQPASLPDDPQLERGLAAYRQGGCAHCHTIQGIVPLTATGMVGPDLTHLASRRTLGAATLDNNRGNLAGWVLDPQTLKPGVRMPSISYEPQDFHALIAFLESLR